MGGGGCCDGGRGVAAVSVLGWGQGCCLSVVSVMEGGAAVSVL